MASSERMRLVAGYAAGVDLITRLEHAQWVIGEQKTALVEGADLVDTLQAEITRRDEMAKKKKSAEAEISMVALATEVSALRQQLKQAQIGLVEVSERLNGFLEEHGRREQRAFDRLFALESAVYKKPEPRRGIIARLFRR